MQMDGADVVGAVDVSGLRIAFQREGRGPPLVLLHGFVGAGVGSWGYQIEALSDALTVIAWDGPEPAIHQPCRNCSGGRLCGLSFRVPACLGLRSPVCRGGFVRRCLGARARPPAR